MKGMVDSDEEYSRILTPRRNSSYRGTCTRICLNTVKKNFTVVFNNQKTFLTNYPRALTKCIYVLFFKATQSTLDVYEADIEDHDYQHQNAHGDIIFPDSYERTRKKNTSSVTPLVRLGTTPVCAEDSTFCEDIDTYPYEQVKNALADWEEETMMDVFGADEAPTEIIANR